jgi:hypothetical protein
VGASKSPLTIAARAEAASARLLGPHIGRRARGSWMDASGGC